MNAFARRRKAREIKYKRVLNDRLMLKLMHQDKVMVRYEEAFLQVHHYVPNVSYSNGWYRVIARSWHMAFREQDLQREAMILEAKVKEMENVRTE